MPPRDQAHYSPEHSYATNTCSSGKRAYITRKAAKAAAQKIPGHLRPYQCPECGPLWHNGHIPNAVIRGLRSADEHYDR